MVYVSSPSVTLASRQSVMQVQNELSQMQKELASGVDADVGLSLGARSSQYVDLQHHAATLQTIQDNNTLATTRLSSTTTVLDALRTTASSFQSALTTASSSGGLTTSLQTNASSALQSLTAALNTVVSGQYIFAGINTAVQPVTNYTTSPASANKTAVDNAFSTAFGFSQSSASAGTISASSMQSFLNGAFASMFSATGFSTSWSSASNTAISSEISDSQTADTSVSANANAFRELAQAYTMVTEFGGTNFSSGASQAVVSTALGLVNSALNDLNTIESGVGITQNAITSANTAMSAQSDVLKTQMDALVGVDAYDLPTQISNLQTQLQASYEVTSRLQSLSLVNYLT
jgi:flagellar hook-associated protein 3 FlgL